MTIKMSSIITTSMVIVAPITIPSLIALLAVGIVAEVIAIDSVLCIVLIDTNIVLCTLLRIKLIPTP